MSALLRSRTTRICRKRSRAKAYSPRKDLRPLTCVRSDGRPTAGRSPSAGSRHFSVLHCCTQIVDGRCRTAAVISAAALTVKYGDGFFADNHDYIIRLGLKKGVADKGADIRMSYEPLESDKITKEERVWIGLRIGLPR